MTVVAVYRGKPGSCNAMVADTICNFREAPSETAFWTDKVSPVFGNTYAAVLGDADVTKGLRLVVDSLDPRRPNLREPEVIDAALGTVERIWTLRERAAGAQRFGSKGSIIVFCTRADAFFWIAGYDNEARRFERPSAPYLVSEGECVIFWGSNRFTVRDFSKYEKELAADPFKLLVTLIVGADTIAREQGKQGLLYQLDGRFSGVVLPHKTSNPLRRIHPFPLPELLARDFGPNHLELLQDPDFMAYEPPPAK